MAGLVQKKSGVYNVNWRFRGKLFNRSTGTTDAKKACLVQKRVEDALFKLQNGLISIPDGADVSDFVLNGGRLRDDAKPLAVKPITLEELFNQYSANLAVGRKRTRFTPSVSIGTTSPVSSGEIEPSCPLIGHRFKNTSKRVRQKAENRTRSRRNSTLCEWRGVGRSTGEV